VKKQPYHFSLSPKNLQQKTGMEIIKNNLFKSSYFKNTDKSQIRNLEQSFEKQLDSPKARKMLIEIVKYILY